MAEYIYAGIPTMLVEPQVEMMEQLKQVFGQYLNVEFLQKLITQDGLYRRMVRPSGNDPRGFAQTAYVEGIYPPIGNQAAMVTLPLPNDQITRGADCCTMLMIDPGDIDVLNLDVEGSEWLVLSTMVSRPKLIHVEVYGAYGYVNPDLHKIEAWMGHNGYREIPHPDLKDAGQNKVYVRDV